MLAIHLFNNLSAKLQPSLFTILFNETAGIQKGKYFGLCRNRGVMTGSRWNSLPSLAV